MIRRLKLILNNFVLARFKEAVVVCALLTYTSSLNLHLNCKVDPWHLLGNLYSCDAKVLSFGTSGDFDSFTFKHLDSKTNSDVRALNLENQRITRIPKKIDQFFYSLNALSFYKSDILRVSKYDLQPFVKLQYLGLKDNKITKLPGDLFQFTPSLVDVDFSGNRIRTIGSDLLDHAPRIRFIHFVSNVCTSISVRDDPSALRNLKSFIKTNC